MTVEQCYQAFEGDFAGVSLRISKPALLHRLLRMFPQDPSMAELKEAVASGNGEKAFRAIHTLKGVALNMGFTRLAELSSELTELLRGRELVNYEECYQRVLNAYDHVVEILSQLDPV